MHVTVLKTFSECTLVRITQEVKQESEASHALFSFLWFHISKENSGLHNTSFMSGGRDAGSWACMEDATIYPDRT